MNEIRGYFQQKVQKSPGYFLQKLQKMLGSLDGLQYKVRYDSRNRLCQNQRSFIKGHPMPQIPRSYRLPLMLAIALHVALIIALIVHLPANTFRLPGPVSKAKIIHAVAVNPKQVQQQIHAVKQKARQAQKQKLARIRKAQAKIARIKRAKRLKQQRLLALKKKRLALKRQRALAKKQAQARAEKVHAEKIKQQKALADKQKTLMNKMLAQQMAHDQQQLTAAKAAQNAGVIDQYKARILQAIGGYWVVPAGANDSLKTQLLIKLAPGGAVLTVQMLRSSGNVALDRSAEVAVYKASPLPVPKDPAIFDKFRLLRLTVSPKEIING